MFHGKLLAIAIAPEAKHALVNVDSIAAMAGRGLVGDRYAEGKGVGSRGPTRPDQEVTLIEKEALGAAAQDYELALTHLESRRNLLTEGVPLNHLVGQTFAVGEVLLKGVELCEPCSYLENLTGQPVKKALVHRGGLRANVLRSGVIKVGDAIVPAEAVT